jgi:hypothetical protein
LVYYRARYIEPAIEKENAMRIWGNILLIFGILFLVLMVLAEFGGGHLGFVPFFVSGLLIFMGYQMRTSGKGILQSNPAATAEQAGAATIAAPGLPAAHAGEFSTVELPLTPEVAAVITSQNARTQRLLFYVLGGIAAFMILLGVILDAANVAPGHGTAILALLSGIGVASAILIYAIAWLTTQKPVRRDLRGTTYLRTTGPVQVVRMSSGGMLRLADRAFFMNGRNGMTELSTLGWGRVDYSPHGHVILAAWDNQGRTVYALPGYTVSSGTIRA